MTIQKISNKIEDQIDKAIYPGASLALYQAGRWQEFYFGLADPQEKKATWRPVPARAAGRGAGAGA